MSFQTIAQAASALSAGSVTAAQLVEEALERIGDPGGEGRYAFVSVQASQARAAARAMDALRGAGRAPSIWAGIPISIKDLYDQAGEITRAGSVAREDASPAPATAAAVLRLEQAGFIVLGEQAW